MIRTIALICLVSLQVACSQKVSQKNTITPKPMDGLSKAYFASGCFWCVEAIFESVEGVGEVISGYAGGDKATATYGEVSSGTTKHAESVEVYYDPKIVDYNTLLEVFFGSHDPTTLNQQGNDRGPQYRSAIFYNNESEQQAALAFINKLYESNKYSPNSITTEVTQLQAFYPAEAYHQDYERRNPNQPYVKAVSIPRLNKFKAAYPHLLKKSSTHN